ncbi:MAG: DUF4118 domain-containing protein, partial [Gemmatimonadetes bacterium]|nr:DUF4118 domain-containing protein [Gemmatimonadota bacterium]
MSDKALTQSVVGWLERQVETAWSAPARYGIALMAWGIALAATLVLSRLLQPSLSLLFWPAVVLTALLGGVGPAVAVSLLSVLAIDYFLIPPPGFSGASVLRQPGLAVFLGTSVALGWLTGSLRRYRQHALADALAHASAAEASRGAEARAIERDREFLEQAQRIAQLGSWEWDIGTNVIVWSSELYRLYGMDPGSPIDYEHYLSRVHPEDREGVQSTVAESRRSGRQFSFEHRVVSSDGTVRWLHGLGSVVQGADGTPIRMVGSSQDVTKRRRASEAQRMLAQAAETLVSLDRDPTL